MLRLRDYSPPRQTAAARLPRFPERAAGRIARNRTEALLTSRAERHARMAWDDARRYAINKAATASVVTDGKPSGLLELVMISALAQHLRDCPMCWIRSPYGGDKPGEWVTWATVNSRLREYLMLAGQPLDVQALRKARVAELASSVRG